MKNKFNIDDVVYYFSNDRNGFGSDFGFHKNTIREVIFKRNGISYNLANPFTLVSERGLFSTIKEAYEATLKSNKEASMEQLKEDQEKIKKEYQSFSVINCEVIEPQKD
jgi:hypothetical protein